jgi:hypothetical protein
MEAGSAALPAQDAEMVIAAFRFGWAVAELRGRYRPSVSHVEEMIGTPELKRSEHALPLATERSSKEQRIEVIRVVQGLSQQLALTFPESDGATTADRLNVLMRQLDSEPTKARAWEALTEGFYNWDKRIQDTLVLRPLLAAAYQLGRGLAETYWELDPAVVDPRDSRSWEVVLGEERVEALKRATARLAAFVDPLTIPAVHVSLERWREVAADAPWRAKSESRHLLFEQGLVWRDLVRGERQPADLVVRSGVADRVGVIWPLVRTFWPQVLIGAAALAALLAGAAQLAAASGSKSSNTVISILGGLGITSAGLYTRAKATATSTMETLRKAFTADRVGEAATLRPKPPLRTRVSLKRLPSVAAEQFGHR